LYCTLGNSQKSNRIKITDNTQLIVFRPETGTIFHEASVSSFPQHCRGTQQKKW